MYGYGGNDILQGYGGLDELYGGDGDDILYGNSNTFYPDPADVGDKLYGNLGNDQLYGDLGDDTLDGGFDFDTLDGGSGIDTADYTFFSGRTSIDLVAGRADFPDNNPQGQIEQLISIENVVTGGGQDIIKGDNGANMLSSGAGNDTVDGGVGDDTLNGGADSDTVVLAGLRSAYTFSGAAADFTATRSGETDTILGVEFLTFENGETVAVADLFAASRIEGGPGPDTLRGTPNNDIIDGKEGADTAVYASLRRETTITGTLQERTVASPAEGTDTLRSVEVLQFADGRLVYDVDDPAALVYRLFDAAFDRTPDPLGFNYWIEARENGASVASLASNFAASAEFQAAYGSLTNQTYVEELYRTALNREGEAAGVASWTNALNAGAVTRADVLAGFSEAAEHIELLRPAVEAGLWDIDETAASVARLYYVALDRTPDAGGVRHWTDAVKSGTALASVADAFVFSPEFQGKYSSLNNEQFVTHLYGDVLDRPADQAGFDFWTSRLNTGELDRSDVVLSFSGSPELQAKTISVIDQGILFA
jgi:Ca2+-binding RTX toxin-like protein